MNNRMKSSDNYLISIPPEEADVEKYNVQTDNDSQKILLKIQSDSGNLQNFKQETHKDIQR